jgi:hypothetical protein
MRAALRAVERRSRFGFDYQLVCTLLDRWRPETHSFHFPLAGDGGDFVGRGPPLQATVLRGAHGARQGRPDENRGPVRNSKVGLHV